MTDPAVPTPTSPPIAKAVPFERAHHGDTVNDPYAWMRDREGDPDVVAYLESENAWTDAQTAHLGDLRQTLFEEIKSRVEETDLSVPVRKGDWEYYSRTTEGQQYPAHCRRAVAPGSDPAVPSEIPSEPDAAEQVMLDQNVEADGLDFYSLGVFSVSHDHRLLAHAADNNGSEVHTLRFRDLETGTDLDDVVEGVYYGSAWAADNATFFYTRPDDAMRPHQLWRHRLGTPASDDVMVFQEDDERFFVGVSVEKDDSFIQLHVGSKITDETWLLPADDPTGEFVVVQPREQGVEYAIDHHGDRFFIVTNIDGAENFKLMEAPESDPSRAQWTDVIAHRPDVKLSGIDLFTDHLVLFERAEGVSRIRIRQLSTGDEHTIDQPEAVSTASPGANPEFDSAVLRYGYQSMVTPSSIFSYDMSTRERTLLKQQIVLGDYDPDDYVTERLWAPAADGTRIPMSIVRRKDFERDGTRPGFLYGYGSYEASIDPYYSSVRLSLLDRGFSFAIAHVRGGGEMGRPWYNDGKLLAKRNTFTDFIACAEHLVADGWTSADRLVARGGSAGGLLMGAVVNEAPTAFGGIIAEVPFVDALNTILDPSLPLTVLEWEEWGNPLEDPDVYAYMKSYAPYENVEAKHYPPMLVTAGLNDPRVSYWEPAKWVAKMRTTKTDANQLLLKTDMGAGHMGPSGRYNAWHEEAFVLAWVLDTVGD